LGLYSLALRSFLTSWLKVGISHLLLLYFEFVYIYNRARSEMRKTASGTGIGSIHDFLCSPLCKACTDCAADINAAHATECIHGETGDNRHTVFLAQSRNLCAHVFIRIISKIYRRNAAGANGFLCLVQSRNISTSRNRCVGTHDYKNRTFPYDGHRQFLSASD